VHALGVILYQLVCGRLPYDSPSVVDLLYHIRHDPPPPLRERCRDIPAELEQVCLACLAKEPNQRPAAGELADRLDGLRQRAGAETGPWKPGQSLIASPSPLPPGPRPSPRRKVLLVVACVLALAAGGVLSWGWPRPLPGEDETAKETAVVESSLRIRPLEVMHFAVEGKKGEPQGLLGEKSLSTRFGDQLQLMVKLSEPGYFYVIGFAANGKENLVWPADEEMNPLPSVEPEKLARLRFPGGDKRLTLDDSPKGGLEVFAVAASRQPLPPFAEWRRRRKVTWQALPAGKAVWQADVKGTYLALAGLNPDDRASVKAAVGVPPLSGLCRALLGDGVETVELIAFPVRAKEGK
jgi:hypothetical protein